MTAIVALALICAVLALGLALASLIGPDPLETERRREPWT